MKTINTTKSYQNERINEAGGGDACAGQVVWSPVKSIWITTMFVLAIVGGVWTFSIEAFAVFLISSAVTLCLGHSLGMHRKLIHHSYDCPKWLEYLLVHLGVVVGLAGPKGMMKVHDIRDWAQRQPKCHDFFSHQQAKLIDFYWALHCDFVFDKPPEFTAEQSFVDDKVYQWMEKYWLWQQLPLALLLFVVGGVDWVIWGSCVRVAVCVTGHWFIGYMAHNNGDRHWHVEGASVQGYNIKFAALITMGESWHNNHHAFPGSALLGIEKGQMDPGWWVLLVLNKLGLVWDIKLPADLPERDELQRLVAD